MKKRLLTLLLLSCTLNLLSYSQSDKYWSGNGSSDNISDGQNWWSGSNPASGDNLYFNNTAGSHHWAYANYSSNTYFNYIIVYNGAGGIRWYGDKTYAYKYENNSDANVFEIANNICNRGGNDFQLNPVGSGGIHVLSSGTVTIQDGKILYIYGSNTLTFDGNINELNGSGNIILTNQNPTVLFTAANTYTGLTTINGGKLQLNHSGGGTIPSTNNVTVNAGTLQISSNQTLNNLTLASGSTLTIDAGVKLTVTGKLTQNTATINNSGNIIIAPGASFLNSSAINNVTLQQSITAQRGYRIFANPFSTPQTDLSSTGLNTNVSTANDVKTYDNASNAWVLAGTGYSSVNIGANTPYACFIRGASTDNVTGLNYTNGPTAFTYSVTGTLNTGTYTVPTASNASNFSIIGNPYAAPINSDALTGGTGTHNSYYVYQTNQNVTNAQTKAGGWVAVPSANSITPIPVLGVVALQTAGNYTILTSDINVTNAPATNLFGVQNLPALAEITALHNGNFADKMFVRLDANATAKGTDKIDLQKFYNDAVNFYSKTEDGKSLAIDARNSLSNIIPLVFTTDATGNYSFKLTSNSLPQGTIVYLNDKYSNTKIDLTTDTIYNFSVTSDTASQGSARFELQFSSTNKTQAIDDNNNTKFGATVLGNVTNNNQVTVQISGTQNPVTIKVIDMNGKVVNTVKVVNGTTHVNIGQAASGMTLLQISDGKNTIIKKVMKL